MDLSLHTPAARTALVTGASGFVGRRLCCVLAEHGWNVSAIAGSRCGPYFGRGTRTESLPLLAEPQKWQLAMRSIECVIHLAARVHKMGSEGRAEAEFNQVNVDGSRFVAEQASRAGVQRFIFLSSVKVHGEGGGQVYRADDMPGPRDTYGRSKLGGEQAIREVCQRDGMDLVIIRSPLVYGPGVKANFLRLIRLADSGFPLPFGSIENRRSMIGLGNLVDFIETCMVHPDASKKIWLIADDESVSTPDLVRRLCRYLNRPSRLWSISPSWLRSFAVPLRLRGIVDRLCESLEVDSSPARSCLGWRPKYSLDEELARTVVAYRLEHTR